jgi:type I restriction enzyme S subunit
MPNNWNTYKLGEIADIKGGKRLPKGNILVLEKTNHPYIRVTDMGTRTISIEKVQYVPTDVFPKISRYIVNTNDLILSIVGTVGSISIIDKKLNNASLTENCVKITNLKDVDNVFLYYYLMSDVGQFEISKGIVGSTQPKLPIYNINALEILLPENPQEQQSIASILSAIDDKIENNLAINKTLEEMAMALYKHWFVDFGPFQEGEFVESELGMIPKDWDVKIVKDFGDVITGKTPEKKYPEHFGDVIPFITPTDFKDYGKHIVSANRYISELGIKKLNKNILPINSVIVTCIGSDMGKVALSKVQSLTNQQINSLKSKHYLYMYCFFINNYTLLKRMAGDGTTMPIINKSSFENIKVIYPSKIVLNDFEKLINDYDEQILSNTLENQTLTQLRDTLLPQLISGAVRLKEFRE